jgi:hypothetical protein
MLVVADPFLPLTVIVIPNAADRLMSISLPVKTNVKSVDPGPRVRLSPKVAGKPEASTLQLPELPDGMGGILTVAVILVSDSSGFPNLSEICTGITIDPPL